MDRTNKGPYSRNSALLLWLAWIFGFAGMHRIYLGKPISGILYFLTWGLFGVGQVFDLLRMNNLVDSANAKQLAGPSVRGYLHAGSPSLVPSPSIARPPRSVDPEELLRMKLLSAAAKHGNALSVTQGVMATGRTFGDVEAQLDQMAKSGYVGIDNDAETGAVIYTFRELS